MMYIAPPTHTIGHYFEKESIIAWKIRIVRPGAYNSCAMLLSIKQMRVNKKACLRLSRDSKIDSTFTFY